VDVFWLHKIRVVDHAAAIFSFLSHPLSSLTGLWGGLQRLFFAEEGAAGAVETSEGAQYYGYLFIYLQREDYSQKKYYIHTTILLILDNLENNYS
jgi:hypothetical protein